VVLPLILFGAASGESGLDAYCRNTLKISSNNPTSINTIYSSLAPKEAGGVMAKLGSLMGIKSQEEPVGLLEFLCPFPEELHDEAIESDQQESLETNWRMEYWGCTNEADTHLCKKIDAGHLLVKFSTPFPPLAAIQHGAKKYDFSYQLLFCDLGCGLLGMMNQREYVEYAYILDKPPAEAGIPETLIDEFHLNEAYSDFLAYQAAVDE
jgi:hypothetical protein